MKKLKLLLLVLKQHWDKCVYEENFRIKWNIEHCFCNQALSLITLVNWMKELTEIRKCHYITKIKKKKQRCCQPFFIIYSGFPLMNSFCLRGTLFPQALTPSNLVRKTIQIYRTYNSVFEVEFCSLREAEQQIANPFLCRHSANKTASFPPPTLKNPC